MEIHYVHEYGFDKNDPILRKITEYCDSTGIDVTLRGFNSRYYEEDAHYISNLPAIHIYTRNVYQDTIYPNFKPIQILRTKFDKFQLEELERETKRQIWEERLKYLRNVFRSLKTDSKPLKSDYL